MKNILILLFCITSSKCGVLKDDLKKIHFVECKRFVSQRIIVLDSFDVGNVTLVTEIPIDVTKDQEGRRPTKIESVTRDYHLQPGTHKWELKFLEESVDEINRIVTIVENTAKKTGQLVSKNSKTGDNAVTWEFNINIDEISQPSSTKHKRQTNAQPTDTEHRLFEVHLIRVNDFFEDGNITLASEIQIDVTKDQEVRPNNIESVTKNYNLQPGMHKWEIKFLSNQQSEDEINRIISIVEKTAKKTGQLVSKNSSTGDNTITWEFNINIDVTSQPSSKKHKRDIQFQSNVQSTDVEEIKRLLSIAETAENKNGEVDGKNCTTTDGVVICNVYIPNDSSRKKRDIKFQNNIALTDRDEVKEKPEIVNTAANPTYIVDDNGNNCTATVTVDNKVICLFLNIEALVGGCPTGTARADDNTCEPII